jgi:hypothetical protein
VLEAFPPRGIIHLLEKQHTQGDRLLVERLVAEEYVLDTCFYFEADRVECAKRLAGGAHARREVFVLSCSGVASAGAAWPHAHCGLLLPTLNLQPDPHPLPARLPCPAPAAGLPLPFPYEPLLCEVLFGQMLRLPRPQFKPLMYSTLMVDLCKLRRLFPRAMSACVRWVGGWVGGWGLGDEAQAPGLGPCSLPNVAPPQFLYSTHHSFFALLPACLPARPPACLPARLPARPPACLQGVLCPHECHGPPPAPAPGGVAGLPPVQL